MLDMDDFQDTHMGEISNVLIWQEKMLPIKTQFFITIFTIKIDKAVVISRNIIKENTTLLSSLCLHIKIYCLGL